jgi:cellulose synthase/poly-beta-1,6-N-acetylglucosamine synthase-like glycosyltransferase
MCLALAVLQTWMASATAYLLVLLAAGARQPGDDADPPSVGGELTIAVLVPANDEEAGLATTLEALAAQRYPAGRHEVIVIADNCTDATASVAAAAGLTVWERRDASARGKGQALAWALERLWTERPAVDAVAIVDADCVASPSLCGEIDRALRRGARAVQARYVVSNPDASSIAALRWAGFALMHVVRPRGKQRLGLSCGLFGTGMALRSDVLREQPWSAFSVTEDAEYHLQLVTGGTAVAFVDRAAVSSPMPTTVVGARAQHLRWETGNARLVRRSVQLLVRGVRSRDRVCVGAALDRLVPPQSLILAGTALVAGGAAALGGRRILRLAELTAVGQAVFVFGGLASVRAPRPVWLALASTPRLVTEKLALSARIALGRGAAGWRRTARQASPAVAA